MGLDVTACEAVELVKTEREAGEDYDGYEDGLVHLYVEPAFVTAADGLQDGYYRTTGEVHGFRAGSYHGYNQWRADLASLVWFTNVRPTCYGPTLDPARSSS